MATAVIYEPGEAFALLAEFGCIDGDLVGLVDEAGDACDTLAKAHPELRRGFTFFEQHGMAKLITDAWGEVIKLQGRGLCAALKYAEDHEDVRDGDDGHQLPNDAMVLARSLREAIAAEAAS